MIKVRVVTPPVVTPPQEVHIQMTLEDAKRLRVLATYSATIERALVCTSANGLGIEDMLERLYHELRGAMGT